jgi:hypothetical protein
MEHRTDTHIGPQPSGRHYITRFWKMQELFSKPLQEKNPRNPQIDEKCLLPTVSGPADVMEN